MKMSGRGIDMRDADQKEESIHLAHIVLHSPSHEFKIVASTTLNLWPGIAC
jgi:hypothetical protein